MGSLASSPTDKLDPQWSLADRFVIKKLSIGDLSASAAVQTERNSEIVSAIRIRVAPDTIDSEDRTLRSSAFTDARTMLIEKYGRPSSEHVSKIREIETTVIWTFPSSRITLVWLEASLFSFGLVTITYKAASKSAL